VATTWRSWHAGSRVSKTLRRLRRRHLSHLSHLGHQPYQRLHSESGCSCGFQPAGSGQQQQQQQQRSLARRSSIPDSRHDAKKEPVSSYSKYVAILRFWQPGHHLERQQTHGTAAARTAGSLTTPSTPALAPRPHLPTEIAVFKNPSSNVKPHRQSGFVISATSQPAASTWATGSVGMIFGSKPIPYRCGSWAPSAPQASAKSGLKVCKKDFQRAIKKSPEHSHGRVFRQGKANKQSGPESES
jgi:hypothetical protein